MASLIARAAAPTARTDNPRLRASRPNDRSTAEGQLDPASGQAAARATAIKVAPASITSSDAFS